VVLTHPMVGSYRIDRSELESDQVHARALVVTRLVTPPVGPGLSVEELLVEAVFPPSRTSTPGADPEPRRARPAAVIRSEARSRTRVEASRCLREAVDHVAAVAPRGLPPGSGRRRRGRVVLVDYGVKRSLLRPDRSRMEVVGLPRRGRRWPWPRPRPLPGPGDPSAWRRRRPSPRRTARRDRPAGIPAGHQLGLRPVPTHRLAVITTAATTGHRDRHRE
jgi:carbamoylphosphate synthase small subunit